MDISMTPQDDDARKTGTVRLGPISLFTLIAVLCLSTLAVLSVTTANASYKLANLQSEFVEQQYQAEEVAQGFIAQLCEGRSTSPEAVTEAAHAAQLSTDGAVSVTATTADSLVTAQFMCANGRILDTEVEFRGDGAYRILKWNMTAKVQSAETETLWSGM